MSKKKKSQATDPALKPKKTKPSSDAQSRWWKNPMYLYSGFVIIFSILLFTITSQESFDVISKPINHAYAKISSSIINITGEGTEVIEEKITSPHFSMLVKKGCDAIAPMILLFMTIIAFPTKFNYKIPGIVIGILALAVLNIIRIISLYFIGKHCSTEVFDIMHIDIWQIFFIAFTVFLWLAWMNWMRKKMDVNANA